MKKLLLIGDLHIPERAEKIPDWIIELLKKEKFDLILCTGDLVYTSAVNELKKYAVVKAVQGNMDFLSLPEKEIVEIEGLKIGLIHGTQIHPRGNIEQLTAIAEEMNVDILVHGHTHKLKIEKLNGILLLNPGTATGVWGGIAGKAPETIIILEINKKVKIRKFESGKELL
ncbi:MAG: metallophosphoesterase [Candidatus ainarchaeum sp.]|nr:metallophosphoesterase [Candidatus ainarchaeum sp.]